VSGKDADVYINRYNSEAGFADGIQIGRMQCIAQVMAGTGREEAEKLLHADEEWLQISEPAAEWIKAEINDCFRK
jgi:hypothetical protein